MGYVTDRLLAQLYRQANLLLMPSAYEGFGLPVEDAMTCGCPVLSSTCGALEEVGGETVSCYDRTDSTALYARAIDELIYDRERAEGVVKRGLKRASWFSWKHTARKTYKVMT